MDNKNYQLGLLYLVHLLINADGIVNESEQNTLIKIRDKEKISDSVFNEFQRTVKFSKLKDIYVKSLELINSCNDEEKKRALVHLYKISQIDGSVHVKEVRLLLYSIKMADIDFDDVVAAAKLAD